MDKVSNKDLWEGSQRTNQVEIEYIHYFKTKRIWGWFVHTLRKPNSNATRQALTMIEPSSCAWPMLQREANGACNITYILKHCSPTWLSSELCQNRRAPFSVLYMTFIGALPEPLSAVQCPVHGIHRSFARTAERRSVFWNSARTSCLTSAPLNSCARGPLPSAHLSTMSVSPAFSTSINSLYLSHLATYLYSSGLPAGSPTSGWKQSGARSGTIDRSV